MCQVSAVLRTDIHTPPNHSVCAVRERFPNHTSYQERLQTQGEKSMTKKTFVSTALVAALLMVFCLPGAAQQVYLGVAQAGVAPVGTEEPCILNSCLMYAGDFNPNGQNPDGLWNANNTSFGILGVVYVPFTIPKKFKGAKGKTDWNVQGLFVNELMEDFGTGFHVSSASWSIVQGVADGGSPTGGQVKTICSGTAVPTLTPTGRGFLGFFSEQTILVTGINCPILEAGSYWMTLVPTTSNLAFLSDVEDSTPANMQGPGSEPADQSFFVSQAFGFPNFSNTSTVCGNLGCDSFSAGIIGTATH